MLPERLAKIWLSRPARVTALGVTLSVALIGILAAYFRRKRGRKYHAEKKKQTAQKAPRILGKMPTVLKSNGDVYGRRSMSPVSIRSLIRKKSGSTTSLGGVSLTSTITHSVVDTSNMSALQLCHLGLEGLHVSVSHWEEGIDKLTYLDDADSPQLAISDANTSALQHQLEHLLELAYRMQEDYERQCIRYGDHAAMDSAISAFAEVDRLWERQRSADGESLSDQDSFVSATDMADLADLESHRELFIHLPLYEAGLMELKYGNIVCRTLRPDMAQCLSDTEFLAKLHCLRLAFELVFKDESFRSWFSAMGKQLIGDLMLVAQRDPDDFYTAYDLMMEYVNNSENWAQMEDELRGRGVKCFSFYDIVLDFILMDAFDDLETPPSSVVAVVQNRWLSNGFKETALSTAVWSVLKAKRRLLKYPNGFIGHFYAISENVSPVFAWGFLGPDSNLKEICVFFKDVVLGFICDIFSFEYSRYTTVEELADDIVRIAKSKSKLASQEMAS